MSGEEVIELNPDQTKLTTLYTEKAVEFISENKNRPFFLYLAHAKPHVPLFVSKKFKGHSKRGLYGDVIEEIDWSVGRILEHLKKVGIDDKTLVVYTSDNGPWLEYGIDGGSAGPLRGGKGSVWEGGVRVPAIMRWPGRIPAGRRTSEVAANMDLLPTFANLAGAQLPEDRTIDGRNLWSVIKGGSQAKSPHEVYYYFGGSGPGSEVNLAAVRDDRWKLHVKIEGEQPRGTALYDLQRDFSEKRDRVKDHPDIAERLEKKARVFWQSLLANRRPFGRL
jgi:arylsulfatase A-like enzyme